ncbi:TraR/DksA family transcriptional regulator [Litoreibacter ponti]|uniref:TraR/DksA family transcriptional regulator n=1 Tax=Litoreibacter ponti TaxID=1510457 RepID=A0A2T6BCL5_9RHOB|nr:TraR/DksA family transcriptional regulator [Litoreibacter ponti]PTX53809.1 TraR/DksA family transcriptional regulator [Litoreibacter ponti]
MTDLPRFKKLITDRLQELDARVHEVDHELAEPKSADLNEQAIDLEDDEVLESLGAAAQKEIGLLRLALKRIADGSYGICASCEEPISDARLEAVPYAPLCKRCAKAG